MSIKHPKKIEILSSVFNIKYNKEHNGGSFSWENNSIEIGIKDENNDTTYTYSIISHEIMEVILTGLGGRFQNGRTQDNFLFNFDHQTFENAIQLHSTAMLKFVHFANN